MTTTYFEDMMQEGFGCHVVGRVALGVRGGRPYSAELMRSGDAPEIELRFAAADGVKPALDVLRARKLAHVQWGGQRDAHGGLLMARLLPPSDFYAKGDIHTVLQAAADALEAQGLQPVEECPLCGLAGCDVCAYVDDAARATHAACLETRLELPEQDEVPEVRVRGNVALGVLGAFVGALLGALPNWALALGQGRVHWALYAFIPIFSALVYRLFRGKAWRNFAGLMVIIASLAAAFALEQVWYWLYETTVTGRQMSLAESWTRYFASHDITMVVDEMRMSLLALVVGLFPSAVFIRQYTKEGLEQPRTVRGRRFVLESAWPIDATKTEAEPDTEKQEQPVEESTGAKPPQAQDAVVAWRDAL